jgi:hypothetical protein
MNRNTQKERGDRPENNAQSEFDFDTWAIAVKKQMLTALRRRGAQ